MKVLLDPVHTHAPHKCAGNFKMQLIAKHLVEHDPGVFITYFLPMAAPDDQTVHWHVDESKLFQHPRVKYEYLPASKDRIRDTTSPPQEWVGAMMFNGTHWDADVIITGRMMMGPSIQVMRAGMKSGADTLKRFIVLGSENFPMIPNKGAVPYYDQICDNLVYGHLGFDRTYVHIEYFRKIILDWGRKMFSAAKQRKLAATVACVQPLVVHAPKIKSKDSLKAVIDGSVPFTVAYTQRFDVQRRRTGDVLEIMKRFWMVAGVDGQPVRCVISSVSASEGRADLEFSTEHFEKMSNTRDEYLRLLHEEVHAVIVLSREEGHSFTTIEPLLMGVPVVLWRRPWSESLVGPDYPFFVEGKGDIVQEAFAMLRSMKANYAATYKTFHAWMTQTYWPMLQERNAHWLGLDVQRTAEALWGRLREAYATKAVRPSTITEALLPFIEKRGTDVFDLADVIAEAYKAKAIDYDHSIRMTDPLHGWRNSRTGSYSQGLYINKTRQDLIFHYGYQDAGCEPGRMKKCDL